MNEAMHACQGSSASVIRRESYPQATTPRPRMPKVMALLGQLLPPTCPAGFPQKCQWLQESVSGTPSGNRTCECSPRPGSPTLSSDHRIDARIRQGQFERGKCICKLKLTWGSQNHASMPKFHGLLQTGMQAGRHGVQRCQGVELELEMLERCMSSCRMEMARMPDAYGTALLQACSSACGLTSEALLITEADGTVGSRIMMH